MQVLRDLFDTEPENRVSYVDILMEEKKLKINSSVTETRHKKL